MLTENIHQIKIAVKCPCNKTCNYLIWKDSLVFQRDDGSIIHIVCAHQKGLIKEEMISEINSSKESDKPAEEDTKIIINTVPISFDDVHSIDIAFLRKEGIKLGIQVEKYGKKKRELIKEINRRKILISM